MTGRHATMALFVVHALTTSLWVNHIASIKAVSGLGDGQLATALLAASTGALAGTLFYTRIGRWAPTLTPVLAVSCPLALLPVAAATGAASLSLALFGLGVCTGLLNVAMNSCALAVEARTGRAVIGTCHALWSIANVAGCLVVALTLLMGLSPLLTCCVGAAALLGVAVRAGRRVPHAIGMSRPGHRGLASRRVWWFGLLAMGALLCEGAVADWAGVYMHQELGAPLATSTLAYGAYSIATTIGRLVTDRMVGLMGREALLRTGGLVAASGAMGAVFAPSVALAIVGWAITGLGLSVVVPVLYGAVPDFADEPASAIAKVSGLGYLGLLAGPALIGALSHGITLEVGMLVITATATVIGTAGAPLLRPARYPIHQAPADIIPVRTRRGRSATSRWRQMGRRP